MKHALVTTTINIPYNLEAYAKDIAKHGPADTVILVAGDLKTPPEIQQFLDKLYADYDVPTLYLPPGQQDLLFPGYSRSVPWNCIQRRNIAILYAYHCGAEIIATIDDDNFWQGEGYFTGHGNLGVEEKLTVVTPRGGWFNPCMFLLAENHTDFFPRGYSLRARKEKPGPSLYVHSESGRCVVNAGLWTGEPDIDAVTRLAISPIVTLSMQASNYSLDRNTKCPFNSQNTALHRDVIPAYCLAHGLGRFDDIIASYVVKRIADHLGDYVRFGSPVVHQERNQHDLWKDLEEERVGMQLTDRIVDWLYEIPLAGSTYKECVKELLPAFDDLWRGSVADLTMDQITFLLNLVSGYNEWLEVV